MSLSSPRFIYTLLLLWLAHFAVDFMLGIWSIYKTITHLDLGKAGIIAGVSAFIGEGGQVITGVLGDRGWRKQLLIVGVISTCASMLLAYTGEYSLLFLLYLCTCLGSGAFHPTAAGIVGDIGRQRRGIFIAIFSACGALGMASSQIVFTQMYFWLQGNTIWLIIPSFILVGMLLSRRVSFPSKQGGLFKVQLRSYLSFFRNRHLALLYISQLCNQAVFWGTVFLLPDVLLERNYDPWLCYGGGHLIYILGAAIMMIPGGYLADRYSSRNVIIGATIVALMSYLVFFCVYPLSALALCFCLFFMGASAGMVNPVSVSFGVQLVPENPSMVSAFLMGFVWCISEILGQVGGGLLTGLFTEDAPACALVLISSLMWIGLACAIRLPIIVQEGRELYSTVEV